MYWVQQARTPQCSNLLSPGFLSRKKDQTKTPPKWKPKSASGVRKMFKAMHHTMYHDDGDDDGDEDDDEYEEDEEDEEEEERRGRRE